MRGSKGSSMMRNRNPQRVMITSGNHANDKWTATTCAQNLETQPKRSAGPKVREESDPPDRQET